MERELKIFALEESDGISPAISRTASKGVLYQDYSAEQPMAKPARVKQARYKDHFGNHGLQRQERK